MSSEADVGNFSEEFTAQPPMNSPGQPPTKHADLFRVSCVWEKRHTGVAFVHTCTYCAFRHAALI